ncbi:YdeI/OmpD-associated family protein [Pedobacter sp. GR22-6]|uniref:YdeI/OmpD-associated family protein n=1 Tax=Pedobacter sp. GR22-6 TaxID=3127957 RepID=UPI00307D08C2
MENALLKKMFFKPAFTLILANAPENAGAILGNIQEISIVSEEAKIFDALLLFVKNSTELSQQLSIWGPKIADKTLVWIAYPKKTSGIATDLKMEKWQELEPYQLTPCGSAAIDETWTGLRIKPVGSVKSSGIGNQQIKTNEFSEFINVDQKTVTAPPELARLFLQHPQAGQYFESLAYSHKKEYVIWILTAKQEATRINRLQKTIEMLMTGKKNPTEK